VPVPHQSGGDITCTGGSPKTSEAAIRSAVRSGDESVAGPFDARRKSRSRLWRLVWIGAYSFCLLLALRFGARTYPGWYFPDSRFLTDLLNGGFVFTQIGYDLVLVAAASGTSRLFLAGEARPRACRILRLVEWTAIALALLIVCYGLISAIEMQRLPWQPDGRGSFLA
jgi:hypothetical protein